MNDRKTSTCTVVAYALWTTAALLLAAAWGMCLAGLYHRATLLGLTACAVSAVAAVAHVRCFAIRLSCIVRRLWGVEVSDQEDYRVDAGRRF